MRRVRLSAAISLDGYIAGPNGEIDWIIMDPDIDFNAFMASFDTVVMGRKSYEAAREQSGGMPAMETYVISRSLQQADCPGVIVSDKPAETLAALKATPGRDIWLFGGGVLFRDLLDLRLVDVVEVAVIPVLLGSGVTLLPQRKEQTRLKLFNHRLYEKTGIVYLEYETV